MVYAPLKGEVIDLAQVKDETFAGEVLGKGLAIVPKEGKIYAPFDGVVTTVFDTKHAIGLSTEEGLEILIHVGINTVELEGKYYETFAAEGDKVNAGDLILTVDLDGIRKAGYDTTTPVIVTNSDDYSKIEILKHGETEAVEGILKVEK